MKRKKVVISVVIPAYNEEKNVEILYQELKAVLKKMSQNHEIIFIDDGSTDSTFEQLKKLHAQDKRLKVVRLRRNFGKSQALAVGFDLAQGDFIVTLDADLQDDPKEISKLLEKINKGWDLVTGQRLRRKDPFEKRLASRFFNQIVSLVSGVRLKDFNCGLRVYRKEVIETINVYGELHRFIPLIANSYGFKVSEIPVKHRQRRYGQSKFGKERYLPGLFDLFTTYFITGYQRRPLHFLGKISLAALIIGGILFIYVVLMKYLYGVPANRPALIVAIFVLGFSIQIFLFGLLADLLSYANQKQNFKKEDFISEKLF